MPEWIEFDSLVNARDVGGLPTTDGRTIRPGVLLRSDNLQDLTDTDIDRLRERGVTDVIDLRTNYEVTSTGPGPLARVADIAVHHLSLFKEQSDGKAEVDDPEVAPEPLPAEGTVDTDGLDERVLPWVGKAPSGQHDNPITAHYLSYLIDRPDSVLAALRVIANARGATLVHCAAGKDRTGTIVALAVLLAGADLDAVVADYAASGERLQLIIDRLITTPTYRANLEGRPMSDHVTRPGTMRAVIEHIGEAWGGVEPLLTSIGWTAEDTERLRAKLLGPSG